VLRLPGAGFAVTCQLTSSSDSPGHSYAYTPEAAGVCECVCVGGVWAGMWGGVWECVWGGGQMCVHG
jgi:hypothetical protein